MSDATSSDLGRPEARPLLAVFGATFFIRFAFGITTAIFASYLLGQSQGLGGAALGTVGLVIAMSPIGEFTTVLFSGAAADRWGRWQILVAGMGAAAILTALVSTTRSPIALGAINLSFGVASGAILASSLALVADASGPEERGLEMGRFDAMNLSGWVLGFAFGLAALTTLPNSALGATFLLSAAVLVAGVLFILLAIRGHAPWSSRRPRIPRLLAQALRRPEVWWVTLPWLTIYMLIGTALAFLGASSGAVGIPPIYLALVIGVGGILLVFTQPTFGRWSDRFGRIRLLGVGTTGFVVVMVAAALIASYGALPILLAVAGIGVVGALAYGPAALAALTDLSASLTRATTMAIYSLTISLGMVLGLVVSTTLYDVLGTLGLDLFFGGISAALVAMTLFQWQRIGSGALKLTTPAR
ncbi:MAG: MFS transporter [Thermoplasmata archaeon]